MLLMVKRNYDRIYNQQFARIVGRSIRATLVGFL
jgi:hypothetical protein